MSLCCPSDITKINMSQSCVKLYECTKFGTDIVGETYTNSVTWFCAYLCKTEDTCCNIWCTTCGLLWPLSANISKSAQVFIFCFQEIFPSIVHILKTQLVSLYHQLYFLPPWSCFHAHLLALSHLWTRKLQLYPFSGVFMNQEAPAIFLQWKKKYPRSRIFSIVKPVGYPVPWMPVSYAFNSPLGVGYYQCCPLSISLWSGGCAWRWVGVE